MLRQGLVLTGSSIVAASILVMAIRKSLVVSRRLELAFRTLGPAIGGISCRPGNGAVPRKELESRAEQRKSEILVIACRK